MRDAADITGEEATADAGSDPRPIVVVHYRRGWAPSLTIALLVLVAAGAVLSHRLKTDDWRGVQDYLRGPRPAPAPVAEAARPPAPAPSPVVVKVVAPPPREEVAAEPPPPARLAPPPILEPPPRLPRPPITIAALPRPSATTATAAAGDPAPAPAASPWDAIRQEARQKQEQARTLEDAKEEDLERMTAQAQARRAETARLDRIDRDRERTAFRQSLRLALNGEWGPPGGAIRDLCEREGVAIGTAWRGGIPAGAFVSTIAGRRDRVERLRRAGVSEAAILDDLICREDRNRVARNGPKSQEEVVIRAARQLLNVPLTTLAR